MVQRNSLMIMDNDRMALAALENILGKALPGFAIMPPVSEGAQAIRLCTERQHAPSVLLADISMNDINGPSVVRTIRKENGTTAILAMTASVVDRHARDMAQAGAQGIVSKNDDVRLLAMAVKTVAEGGVWSDAEGVIFETAPSAHRRIMGEKKADLSPREMEVTNLWSQGRTAPQIAQELNVAETTVRTHLKRAAEKLGVDNYRELVSAWVRLSAH
jgi:DNA-binding NarL/FixJ family response regulator